MLTNKSSHPDRVATPLIFRFRALERGANAQLNGVELMAATEDLAGRSLRGWAIVTAGDVCHERPLAERVMPWLRALAADGVLVLLGDPGRAYLPRSGLVQRARYRVPTSREIEDCDWRDTAVFEVLPG